MVFGERDIEVKQLDEGRLDVYDPTKSLLRSSSVDDIAAWVPGCNYDGEAFIFRHDYSPAAIPSHSDGA